MNPKSPGEGIPQPDNRFRIITDSDGKPIGFVVPEVVDQFREEFLRGVPRIERPTESDKNAPKPPKRIFKRRVLKRNRELKDTSPDHAIEAEPKVPADNEPDQNPDDYRFSRSQILNAIGREDFGTAQFDALAEVRLGITPQVRPGANSEEGETFYTQADVKRILAFVLKNDERKKKT